MARGKVRDNRSKPRKTTTRQKKKAPKGSCFFKGVAKKTGGADGENVWGESLAGTLSEGKGESTYIVGGTDIPKRSGKKGRKRGIR